MQDLILVAEGSAFEKLVHEAADRVRIECSSVSVLVHVFL